MNNIERCKELIKKEHECWIGITNQLAIKELLEELEKKNKLEKEVADNIDEVARELDKLSDNIFIVNQAMILQKIAKEKLGKFYID